MSFFTWLKRNFEKMIPKNTTENLDDDRGREEEAECVTYDDGTKLVYFASTTPNENVSDILNVLNKDVQVSLEFIWKI